MSAIKILIKCCYFLLQFELTQDIGDIFKIRLGIIEPPKEEKEENEQKENSSNKKKDKKKKEKEPDKEEGEENKEKMYSWYLEQVKSVTHDGRLFSRVFFLTK